ncbi:YlaI family protein [Bacillus chungangensis]|uniref:Uncharacterized protein YlaI n=1 Tax=Bacillus chungangensis TaxID=587633 RepID=A0ABT9WV81_9BACI|nr:YlaI family protein [Bacillus chungangensis]MDQ0177019.1 uncharacterized protein YlaI [Bacillus chungangensis]
MRVKCVLCEKINTLPDDDLRAKRLRNRPIHTYMCEVCDERITQNTQKRIDSGRFRLYQVKKSKNSF